MHPSDQRTFPLLPNPKDRNRRSRLRCTGMTTKRTIIISRTTIRKTNRVIEAKRGRVWVGRAARPNGSGKCDICSHPYLIHLRITRLVCGRAFGLCIVIYPHVPARSTVSPPGPIFPPIFLSPFISIYCTHVQPFFLSISLMSGFSNCSLAYIYIPANVKPVHNVIDPVMRTGPEYTCERSGVRVECYMIIRQLKRGEC